MIAWMLLLIGSFSSVGNAVDDIKKVDLLELNHIVRSDGSTFEQWIVWDWEPSQRAFVVVAWQRYCCDDVYRMVRGRAVLRWDRCEQNRFISAGSVRETWTDYDPEIENQKVWTIAARRPLWN